VLADLFLRGLAYAKLMETNAMEDFPIWLKVLVWLVIGGTMLYAATAAILSAVNG
jgi:hypothetical protein